MLVVYDYIEEQIKTRRLNTYRLLDGTERQAEVSFIYGTDSQKPYIAVIPRPAVSERDSGEIQDRFVFEIVVVCDSPKLAAMMMTKLYHGLEEIHDVQIGQGVRLLTFELGERAVNVVDETGTVEGSFRVETRSTRPRMKE